MIDITTVIEAVLALIGALITAFLIPWIKNKTSAEKLEQISGVLTGISGGQVTGLLLCMTILPCAMMAASYVLYQKKYRLDEDEYERICQELERKAGAEQ